MLHIAIIVGFAILSLLWFLYAIFIFVLNKKTKNLGLINATLYFLGFGATQKYFMENSIKIDDWFFEALKDLYDKYSLYFQKRSKLFNDASILAHIIMISTKIFSIYIPMLFLLIDTTPYPGIPFFLLSSISFFIFLAYVIHLHLKNYAIAKIDWDKIEEWRSYNNGLSDENFLNLSELKNLYQEKFLKPKRISILFTKKSRVLFIDKVNYDLTDKEIFDTPEKYLYFALVLPYEKILINFKKKTHNFIKDI